MSIVRDLFGWPGTWGTGGNLVAWVLCGALSFGWLHSREKARHVQALALAARHHHEKLEQAEQHHAELKALAEQHNREMHRRLDDHATLVAAAVAAAAAPAAPEPVSVTVDVKGDAEQEFVDTLKKVVRKRGGGGAT